MAVNRLDELLKTTYSEKEEGEVLYGYDREGRRVSMSDLTGSSTYTYDELGRVTGVQSGDGSILKYQYDGFGNLSRLTYPDGSRVTYTPFFVIVAHGQYLACPVIGKYSLRAIGPFYVGQVMLMTRPGTRSASLGPGNRPKRPSGPSSRTITTPGTS